VMLLLSFNEYALKHDARNVLLAFTIKQKYSQVELRI